MTRLLFVTFALFADGFIYGLIIPLVPNAPAQITSEWMLGSMYSGYSIGAIIATLLYGILATRWGHRRPLLIGALLQVMSVLIFTLAPNYPLMLLSRTLQGASCAVIWTGGLALLAEYFPQNRAKTMGIAMMGGTVGLILGPIVGGYLYEWFSFNISMMAAGIMSLVDLVLRFALIAPEASRTTLEMAKDIAIHGQSNPSVREALASTFKDLIHLLKNRRVLAANGVTLLGAWCWCVIESLLPHHLEVTAHASPAQVGTIFTISSLIYACICPPVGILSDRHGPWKTIMLGFFAMALVLPFVAIPKTIFWAGLALILVDICYAFMMDPPLSELGAVAADDIHRRSAYTNVYVTYNIAYSIGMVGSGLMSGAAASILSLQATLMLTGAFMGMILLIVLAAKFFKAKFFLLGMLSKGVELT